MEVEKKSVNGLGIASLVFGIVGILTICGCGIGFFFGLIGVILGILGLTVLKNSSKGFPIAGLIVSGIALVFGSVWMFLYIPNHKSKDKTDYTTASTTSTSTNTSSSSSSTSAKTTTSDKTAAEAAAELEADKEAVKESWNEVKDTFKDTFKEAYEQTMEEAGLDVSSSSSDNKNSSESDIVSPEMKEFCDSIEAFYDQYFEFMNSYNSSDSNQLMEYSKLLEKMADYEEKQIYYNEHIDEMSEADSAYFNATMLRIDAKLINFTVTYDY